MIWIIVVFAACALIGFLVYGLSRFERESAATAMTQVQELADELDQLKLRIRNLETIAAADDRIPDEQPAEATLSQTRIRSSQK